MRSARSKKVDPLDDLADDRAVEENISLSDDAPTADVSDEEVVKFLEDFNALIAPKQGFSVSGAIQDTPLRYRTAVDPANPPDRYPSTAVDVIHTYEKCVETDNLAAGAAIRRTDSLNGQSRLALRIKQQSIL